DRRWGFVADVPQSLYYGVVKPEIGKGDGSGRVDRFHRQSGNVTGPQCSGSRRTAYDCPAANGIAPRVGLNLRDLDGLRITLTRLALFGFRLDFLESTIIDAARGLGRAH